MKLIKGNLIQLAKEGHFDFIGHGCNCFCKMKSGLAPQMVRAFGCDKFPLEVCNHLRGNRSKLGHVDIQYSEKYKLLIGNMYTQYYTSTMHKENVGNGIPLDYKAVEDCFSYLHSHFSMFASSPVKRIGLPLIGCGRAQGDWNLVRDIIERTIDRHYDVTIVNLDENN